MTTRSLVASCILLICSGCAWAEQGEYAWHHRISLRQGDRVGMLRVDDAGSVHVAKGRDGPLQKYDSSGQFLAQLDVLLWAANLYRGGPEVVVRAVSVGADGCIYVLLGGPQHTAWVSKVDYDGTVLAQLPLEKLPAEVRGPLAQCWVHRSGDITGRETAGRIVRFGSDGKLLAWANVPSSALSYGWAFDSAGRLHCAGQWLVAEAPRKFECRLLRYAADYASTECVLTTAGDLRWHLWYVNKAGTIYITYHPQEGRAHLLAYAPDGSLQSDARLPLDMGYRGSHVGFLQDYQNIIGVDESRHVYVQNPDPDQFDQRYVEVFAPTMSGERPD